jgi:hypothetical protein
MPQPTQSDVHVDALLTNISVAYVPGADRYISSRVFPVVPVQKQTDKYWVYTKNDWFRDEAERRADATPSAGSGYNLGTDSYSADVWAFHKDIGDQVRANYDRPLDPDVDATRFVTQRMLMRQELQWVTDYFTTSVWATSSTVTNKWNDYGTSDPIGDVEVAKETILSTTGFLPNTLVMGYQVFRQLKHHPDVIDRIKYTSSANVTVDLLARMFEVDRILVSSAIKATNNEGETSAYAFTHGKHALLAYVNPTPSLLAPSAGYQFVWQGVSDGLGANVGITRFRMQEIRADRIEAQMAWDNKVVAADLGYFFNAAVA